MLLCIATFFAVFIMAQFLLYYLNPKYTETIKILTTSNRGLHGRVAIQFILNGSYATLLCWPLNKQDKLIHKMLHKHFICQNYGSFQNTALQRQYYTTLIIQITDYIQYEVSQFVKFTFSNNINIDIFKLLK